MEIDASWLIPYMERTNMIFSLQQFYFMTTTTKEYLLQIYFFKNICIGIITFFAEIKKRLANFKTNIFMSDDTNSF